jgi:putative DNA primase/helicase
MAANPTMSSLVSVPRFAGRNGAASDDDIERAVSALNSIDATCSHEAWVKIAMAAKSAGLEFDHFQLWSANGGNYKSESDCMALWRSIQADKGISGASLFYLARDQGWQDPAKRLRGANGGCTNAPIPAPRKTPPAPAKQSGDAAKAAEVWDRCVIAPADFSYLKEKGLLPEGLRVYPSAAPPLIIRDRNGTPHDVRGWLVVPCRELDGSLQTSQFISPTGVKLNLPGARFNDSFFGMGNLDDADCIDIAEGIGAAGACHAVTDAAAVAACGSGRVRRVTAALRARYPTKRLRLLADRGKEAEAQAIAREFECEWVEMPAHKASNFDGNDYAKEYGPDALATLLNSAKTPAKPEPRFKLLSRAELEALPPLKWCIRGVLPEAGLAAIYGPSASGKSFLGFDMGAAIAEGCPWFGCRVEAAPVIYIALEGEAGFRLRAAAWEKHRRRKLPDGLRMVLQPFRLTDPQDVQDLAAVIPAGAVTFIDTLNRAAPTADENSSKDMGEILTAAKTLQALTGGMVVLVHHCGKDSTKGLRGHSSLFAALDAAIEVSRDGDRREWRVAKSKDGIDGDAHPFKLHMETLGIDEHGDPITSCAVVRDSATDDIKRVKVPQGNNQRLVLDALRPLFKAGATGKPGAPSMRPCIALEDAVTAGATRLTCTTDKRTSRARTAISGLVARGVLGCNKGWIWLV